MDSAALGALETAGGLEGLELPKFKQHLGIPPQDTTLERAFLFVVEHDLFPCSIGAALDVAREPFAECHGRSL